MVFMRDYLGDALEECCKQSIEAYKIINREFGTAIVDIPFFIGKIIYHIEEYLLNSQVIYKYYIPIQVIPYAVYNACSKKNHSERGRYNTHTCSCHILKLCRIYHRKTDCSKGNKKVRPHKVFLRNKPFQHKTCVNTESKNYRCNISDRKWKRMDPVQG